MPPKKADDGSAAMPNGAKDAEQDVNPETPEIADDTSEVITLDNALAVSDFPDNSATPRPTGRSRNQSVQDTNATIVTLEVGGSVETQQDRDDEAWHEIKHSQYANRPLSGMLSKVERLDNIVQLAIVYYKGIRVSIPVSEMMITLSRPPGQSDTEYDIRVTKLINRMMGTEIDFIVRGTTDDGNNRVAVASRKAAMLSLRRRFYLNTGTNGRPVIYPGRVAEARIIAVSETAIRVDIFGVETSIRSNYLSWGNMGDIRDEFFVGNTILVYILSVSGDTPENISVKADLRSLTKDDSREKLANLKIQTNCIATVTNVSKGIATLSMADGTRAIAHECLDPLGRKPGRGDQVLFVVTRIDMLRGVALGIISRIVKRII